MASWSEFRFRYLEKLLPTAPLLCAIQQCRGGWSRRIKLSSGPQRSVELAGGRTSAFTYQLVLLTHSCSLAPLSWQSGSGLPTALYSAATILKFELNLLCRSAWRRFSAKTASTSRGSSSKSQPFVYSAHYCTARPSSGTICTVIKRKYAFIAADNRQCHQ